LQRHRLILFPTASSQIARRKRTPNFPRFVPGRRFFSLSPFLR
jgi:hypothetical protein